MSSQEEEMDVDKFFLPGGILEGGLLSGLDAREAPPAPAPPMEGLSLSGFGGSLLGFLGEEDRGKGRVPGALFEESPLDSPTPQGPSSAPGLTADLATFLASGSALVSLEHPRMPPRPSFSDLSLEGKNPMAKEFTPGGDGQRFPVRPSRREEEPAEARRPLARFFGDDLGPGEELEEDGDGDRRPFDEEFLGDPVASFLPSQLRSSGSSPLMSTSGSGPFDPGFGAAPSPSATATPPSSGPMYRSPPPSADRHPGPLAAPGGSYAPFERSYSGSSHDLSSGSTSHKAASLPSQSPNRPSAPPGFTPRAAEAHAAYLARPPRRVPSSPSQPGLAPPYPGGLSRIRLSNPEEATLAPSSVPVVPPLSTLTPSHPPSPPAQGARGARPQTAPVKTGVAAKGRASRGPAKPLITAAVPRSVPAAKVRDPPSRQRVAKAVQKRRHSATSQPAPRLPVGANANVLSAPSAPPAKPAAADAPLMTPALEVLLADRLGVTRERIRNSDAKDIRFLKEQARRQKAQRPMPPMPPDPAPPGALGHAAPATLRSRTETHPAREEKFRMDSRRTTSVPDVEMKSDTSSDSEDEPPTRSPSPLPAPKPPAALRPPTPSPPGSPPQKTPAGGRGNPLRFFLPCLPSDAGVAALLYLKRKFQVVLHSSLETCLALLSHGLAGCGVLLGLALAVIMAMISVLGRLHNYAFSELVVNYHITICFGFPYVFRYLVLQKMDWAPHWAPVCLWYSFLVQLLCTASGPDPLTRQLQEKGAGVTVFRVLLPLLFVAEGTSGRTLLLDLRGDELLLLSLFLAGVKMRCLGSPVFLLCWGVQGILVAMAGKDGGGHPQVLQYLLFVASLCCLRAVRSLRIVAAMEDSPADAKRVFRARGDKELDPRLGGRGTRFRGGPLGSEITAAAHDFRAGGDLEPQTSLTRASVDAIESSLH